MIRRASNGSINAPARHSGSLLFADGTRIGSPCTVSTQNLSIGRPWPIKGLAGRRIVSTAAFRSVRPSGLVTS